MSDTPKDALVRTTAPRSFSLVPGSLGEAKEIAMMIANSDFAPKGYQGKPDNVLVAIQMGADLGLKPMQALQNIAVINGRPSIYGDAALALVIPVLERFTETFEGEEGADGFTAVCIAKRKGWPDETRRTFSIADAKAAKLWGKRGRDGQDTPWITYPKRMLQWRARGFTLRDVGADLLLGLILAEEAQDIPIEGTVVSSEVVTSPAVVLLDRIPEGLRDNLEKAFETLSLAPGLRLAKINEFLGGAGVDPEAGAQQLLDWCKDEYAKRKTGMPRAKKGNDKKTSSAGSTIADTVVTVQPSGSEGAKAESDGRVAGPEASSVGSGQVTPPTSVAQGEPAKPFDAAKVAEVVTAAANTEDTALF